MLFECYLREERFEYLPITFLCSLNATPTTSLTPTCLHPSVNVARELIDIYKSTIKINKSCCSFVDNGVSEF